MRLRRTIPYLPHGEGEIDAHNSGGEHATRYSGIEHAYNGLRRAELLPSATSSDDIADFSGKDFQDILLDDRFEVIIAQQVEIPPDHGNRLAGVAIGQRERTGERTTRMTVSELVVLPELRRREIGSYMLGRLTEHFNPIEIVIATSKFTPEDWFIVKLQDAGFRHKRPDGSPGLWLPGQRLALRSDLSSPRRIKSAEAHVPDSWNGYWEFPPNAEPQLRVFRDGKLLGIIREQKEEFDRIDEKQRDIISNFTISDAGDVELGTLTDVTEKEALIALLNNYELVEG